MKLYLVRHGEAQEGPDDASRTLTPEGRGNAERTAEFLARNGVTVTAIFHSGKTRALETAAILAERVPSTKGVRAEQGLSPMDEPTHWLNILSEGKEDTMLVGHLPFMARLFSLLLCSEEKDCIDFSAAGIVCLQKNDSGRWSLQWSVMPETLGP